MTTYAKHQIFPSHNPSKINITSCANIIIIIIIIIIIRTSCMTTSHKKSDHGHFLPDVFVLFHCFKSLVSNHFAHGMVSLFTVHVCTEPLARVYKELSMTTWNYKKYSL